jgi:hypothetical protein
MIEVLVAMAVAVILFQGLTLLFTAWRSYFTTGGSVSVGSQLVQYAPTLPQQMIADNMLTAFREDDQAAAAVLAVSAQVSPSYEGTSGILTPVLNASPLSFSSPSAAYSLLSSAGITFTANNGFTVFFLGRSAAIISIYSCNYQDTAGIRIYTVTRTAPSSNNPLSYTFAESSTQAQPTPGISLGTSATDPVDYMQIRFPDPGCRLGDNMNLTNMIANSTTRAQAQTNLLRTAEYVQYLQYRR